MLIYQIFLFLICCAFSNTSFASTGWITPTNNELPLGSSTDVAAYVIQIPVDFPPAKQMVEIWLDGTTSRLYYAVYDGTSWSAPANNEILLGSASGIFGLANAVYDSYSQTILLLWQAVPDGPFYYAVYDGTSWTTPVNNQIPLGSASTMLDFNNPINANQFTVIWEGVLHGPLYYATYDGTSWSVPANNEISLGTSSGIRFFYNPCYNPSTNQIMQVWENYPDISLLYYSVFDGTSWSAGSQIPLGLSSGVEYGSFSNPTYDPSSNQILEVWQDENTGAMYYAVFNGTNWTTPSNNLIPLGSSSGVAYFVNLIYDPIIGQLVVIWQDSVNNLLYYATYNGTNWISPLGNQLPLGSSNGISGNTNPIYDNLTEQVVEIWQDSINNRFYYTAYDRANWFAPSNNSIPLGLSTSVLVYRDPTYDSSSRQLVFLWQDSITNRIYYSTYNLFPPLPPASFTGKVVEEHYLTQTDRINLLTWKPSTDPSVVNYLLRRNGTLIYTAPVSGPYLYADHNRNKKKPDTYTLTTQDQQGLESSPLTVSFQ